jgi:hypothetical protein
MRIKYREGVKRNITWQSVFKSDNDSGCMHPVEISGQIWFSWFFSGKLRNIGSAGRDPSNFLQIMLHNNIVFIIHSCTKGLIYKDHKLAFPRSFLLRASCSGLIPRKFLVVKKSCSKIAELPNVHYLSVVEKVSPLETCEFEFLTWIAFVPRYVQRHAGGRENID